MDDFIIIITDTSASLEVMHNMHHRILCEIGRNPTILVCKMGKGKGVQGFEDDGIGLPARFASLFNVAAIGLYVTRVLGGCATLRSTLILIAYRSLCPSFLFFKFPHFSLSFLSSVCRCRRLTLRTRPW